MRWRIATVRAIAVLVTALLVVTCVIVADAALRFEGTCGGLMPFLAAAQPCTRWQYVSANVSFTFAVMFQEYWLIGLVVVGLVFAGSVLVERFGVL